MLSYTSALRLAILGSLGAVVGAASFSCSSDSTPGADDCATIVTNGQNTGYQLCGSGHVDRVAVLAALNLAHELQLLRDENARQAVALQQTLADLNRRLDRAIDGTP